MSVNSGIEVAMSNHALTLNNTYTAGAKFRGSTNADLIFGTSATLPGALTFNSSYANLRNLTFNNNADITLGSGLTINGTLTFPGTGRLLTSSSNLLTFGPAGTYSGNDADSFVDGPVSKTGSSDFIFPTGDGSMWAGIGISSLTASATFRAEYFDAAYSTASDDGTLGSVSGKEYWMLNRTAGSSPANVQLFWQDGNRSEIDQDAYDGLVVAHFNGVNWESKGRATINGSTTAGDVTSGEVDSFSPFTFGTEPTILPMQFVSFQPVVEGNQVALEWQTASENDQTYFTVERSMDGLEFHSVAGVKGTGNEGAAASYKVTDNAPLKNVSYYRIKQTNAEGTASYSAIRSVSFDALSSVLNIYPNPSINGIVHIKSDERLNADNTQVKVYNISGLEQTGCTLSVQEEVSLDMSSLQKGAYFVQLRTPSSNKTFRVFIR